VNSAGLDAPSLYSSLFQVPSGEGPRHFFCKGHYYGYQDRTIIDLPVYPLPTKDGGGLGIHGTKTVDGDVVFGPNVEWMDEDVGIHGLTRPDGTERDYWGVDNEADIKEAFVESIKLYLPTLNPDKLSYSHCGIRPKLSHPNMKEEYVRQHDFYVGEDKDRWINLFGIESPGLTSSMKIGQVVGDMIKERLRNGKVGYIF
jgi:L-2-hydroxyglutarate oxidase LhgO